MLLKLFFISKNIKLIFFRCFLMIINIKNLKISIKKFKNFLIKKYLKKIIHSKHVETKN